MVCGAAEVVDGGGLVSVLLPYEITDSGSPFTCSNLSPLDLVSICRCSTSLSVGVLPRTPFTLRTKCIFENTSGDRETNTLGDCSDTEKTYERDCPRG
jgi:hypothetical protein